MGYSRVSAEFALGYQGQRRYSVAAYWSDGWELRHLDWLRYHGLWPDSERMGT